MRERALLFQKKAKMVVKACSQRRWLEWDHCKPASWERPHRWFEER
jgi:hypothetical protein